MFDNELFRTQIKPLMDQIIVRYDVDSAYITGSFTTDNMWTLGMSDIDLKLFSKEVTIHGKFDITKKCYDYYSKIDEAFFNRLKMNGKEKVELTYNVWKTCDFLQADSWQTFFSQNDYYNAMIITDQLLIESQSELLWGKSVPFVKIPPLIFREYLAKMTSYMTDKNTFTLLNEIKIILYAVRIYHYLWTGDFIYDNDKLLDVISNCSESFIQESFAYALDLRQKINYGSVDTNVRSKEYMALTKKVINTRTKLVAYLKKLDCEFCAKNSIDTSDCIFVLAQGVII